jgi:hypothetical protein
MAAGDTTVGSTPTDGVRKTLIDAAARVDRIPVLEKKGDALTPAPEQSGGLFM